MFVSSLDFKVLQSHMRLNLETGESSNFECVELKMYCCACKADKEKMHLRNFVNAPFLSVANLFFVSASLSCRLLRVSEFLFFCDTVDMDPRLVRYSTHTPSEL